MRHINKTLDCRFNFEVKAVGGDTFVQGWANKCVVDRGKDIINKDAWNLDNYKKVPTILFNHDKDKPIGKAVDVRPTDQGLWIKAKISNSKDPEISKIRDLIQEGMLNAFSVGFDSQDEQKNAEGINEIKQAELYEVSIVTLPMNQDSTFDITSKSLAGLSKEKTISKILKFKGAWVAEAVHGKIYDMEKSGAMRDDILSKISTAAGIDKDVLSQVLSGNITPVPENVLGAFAEVLGLDAKALQKLDEGDVKVQNLNMGSDMKPQDNMEQDEDGKKPTETSATEAGPEKEAKAEEEKIDIIGILVPKAQAASAEEAMQLVKDAGYEALSAEDSGENWYVLQQDPSAFNEETATLNLGDGVMATIGVRKPKEDKKLDEAKPEEEEAPKQSAPEDNKKPLPPHPADEKKPTESIAPEGKPPVPPANPGEAEKPPMAEAPAEAVDADQAKQDYEAFKKDEGSSSIPSWVSDEALWAKAQAASEAASGKMDYAFVVWYYLQNGGGKKSESTSREKGINDAPISGGGDATIPIDDNPYLAQARQTNILLGVLIEEFRRMCATMQGGAIDMGGQTPEANVEPADDELQKQVVTNLKKYLLDLEDKLKKLGA